MILRECSVDALELLELAREALRRGRGSLRRARRCLELGEEELRKNEHTVSFKRAVQAAAEARKGKRKRTIKDFCYVTRRFMKQCPGISKRRVRTIRPEECAKWISKAFDTPSQRRKARSILSGVFGTACKQGWCSSNPVREVPIPVVTESRIAILSGEEVSRLIHTAATFRSGACLPAVGMMLYAGIRPHEVERLTWEDVNMEAGVIHILPKHSKTGGARCVTILPPLAKLLHTARQGAPCTGSICPKNWRRRWAELRKLAGWQGPEHPWQADVLRHTFATHHLATFRSYADLQIEMGHRSLELLRTRYVAMRSMTNRIFD